MKGTLSPFLMFFLTTLITGAGATEHISPPDGWRYPTEKELSDQERSKSISRFASASADFNGDGIPDQAFLLKSTSYSGQGLFVFLSNKDRGSHWVTLDTIDWGPKYPDVDLDMGLEALPAGTYQYRCIVVGNECVMSKTGRLKMTTTSPSIYYYRFGSAASLFYWDQDSRKFIRVWLSI
jgi:hypothetical protein